MKVLKNNFYKNIASILCNPNTRLKSSQVLVLFARALATYPAKSIYCLTAHRVINFIEKNINNVQLMIDIMKDEGEDQEIIDTVIQLKDHPTITTQNECLQFCKVLADYVKWAGVLKASHGFINTLDIIDTDEEPEDLPVHHQYQ